MFIIIKDNNILIKNNLVSEYNYKGLCFYPKNDEYYLSLLDSYSFIDNSKLKKLTLDKYEIKDELHYYHIEVYVYDNDSDIDDFHLYENKTFLIANNNKANIVCKDKYLQGQYVLFKDNKIETNSDLLIYNGKDYHDDILTDGDILEILGVKIIYNNAFLYINNFNIDVRLSLFKPKEFNLQYENIEYKMNCFIYEKPIDLKIEEIKEFTYKLKAKSVRDNIINNIVMVMSMSVVASINYINNTNQNNLQRMICLIMPLSMFLTGIILPITKDHFTNRKQLKEYLDNKNEYLIYLNKYIENLKDNIDEFINSANKHFFNTSHLNNFNSIDFMTISLGKTIISKDIEIKYCEDSDINYKYDEIKELLNNIKDYPVFLDLKKYQRISIVSKDLDDLFNKYLYELSFTNSYDDLYIGRYCKTINETIYNLPHMFYGDHRLFGNDDKGLRMLDQLKYDKPVVIFMLNKSDYKFSNPNIKCIYFTDDKNNCLKDSDVVVEYLNKYGQVISEETQKFNYKIEKIDYKNYFSYLGKIRPFNRQNKIISFMEIYKNYDIKKAYEKPQGLKSKFAYVDNEILDFDLHESKHGPHGLIGGSTGSGKSELIVSLLLSLCLNYPPNYLNIVLIDYKGAGIKDSLSVNGETLPHIIASVSNLENNAFERLIIAIRNECLKRQTLFKKLSFSNGISIMNIDDYNENSKDIMAHLVIVVDEFAELKKEQPTLIKELISLSRIGRSLGIHLILSTQKPGGNIDEEIWSNCKFKIALKVFEDKDSIDLIKCKDATYLKEKGSFILQIDDSRIKANSIYSKKDINNNDNIEVDVLDQNLNVVKTYKEKKKEHISEASYFVKMILDNCKDYKVSKLTFLEPICKKAKEYGIKGRFLLGISDDYINSKYKPIFNNQNDNILICSNRLNELNSFINSLDKRNCIVIASKRYRSAMVSDSLLYDEEDDIKYLFNKLLQNDLDLIVMIEDLNVLLSYSDEYLNILIKLLKRKNKTNYLFVSSSSLINIKLINCFTYRYLINSSDFNDISNIFTTRSQYKANSYYLDNECVGYSPIECEELITGSSKLEPVIKKIPNEIKGSIKDNKYLLGYKVNDRSSLYYEGDLLITSYDDKLLDLYRIVYGKTFTIEQYSHSLVNKNYHNILWLGGGLFSQRLFMTSLKDDLDEYSGLFISGNKKELVRIINHA